mmetsp:Transcript_14172/g.20694  ORF Transcript_14172/g.20694 Transcript_14172/m.20694 type:complete len:157 (-) Transcript_14172:357-827(-)
MCRWVVPAVKDELSQTLGKPAADQIQVACYTFGAPAVGNWAFVHAFNKVVPDTHLIIADGDMITTTITGYRHVGRQNVIDKTGTIRVNPSLVEQKFSLRQRSSPLAHLLSSYTNSLSKSDKCSMSDEDMLNLLRKEYGLPLVDIDLPVSPTQAELI